MSHSETLSRLTVGERTTDMIKWVSRRTIDKFERNWNYDGGNLCVIDASPRAAGLSSGVTALGQFRRDLPVEAWCARRHYRDVPRGLQPMHATRRHDRAGVSPAVRRALLADSTA